MIDKKKANSEKVLRWQKRHPVEHREANKRWIQANYEHPRETRKKAYKRLCLRLRQGAIDALGGVCVSCQCADVRCSQIDHIIPIKGKRIAATTFYNNIIRGAKENLQLLCANCHAIKTYENDENK